MEFKQIIAICALIRNEKGEMLIAQRYEPERPQVHGKWELVGGGVEFGEDPETTVIREVKEEIGVDVKVLRLFPKVCTATAKTVSGESYHVVLITYECEIINGIPKPSDPEISEVRYVPPSEIKNMDAFDNLKEIAKMIESSTA